ncbi:MAG: protein-L-isoaspartate(D-aspartate) O-methyltransferase [Pseudomonadota bacterium]|nr:protein-L-isoaspartate(D-aspartate) O-methyltransferase [Pseudomonadota bacterium]
MGVATSLLEQTGRACGAALLVFAVGAASAQDRAADPYPAERRALVAELRAESGGSNLRPELDAQVIEAIARVPRHRFVPEAQRARAYENRPLPIGHDQTISQPYIVALMTSLLHVEPGDRVLEIGTGSGYQAAVLAEMGAQVYTIEIVEPLARQADKQLQSYPDVHTMVGDGYKGWPEHAPFDAIIVTAAVTPVPPPLLAQLKRGGRMVIPVGGQWETQTLMLIEKDRSGRLREQKILPVRFVPFTGERD